MNRTTTKYYTFLVISLLLSSVLQAQVRKVQNNPKYDIDKFRLGFSLGTNNMYYRMKVSPDILFKAKSDTIYGVETKGQFGFNLGMLAEYNLSKYFSIRTLPGMNFGGRTLLYKSRKFDNVPKDSLAFKTEEMTLQTIDVEIPILFRYKGMRINNYRPYLIAGGNVRYDLESNRKKRSNKSDLEGATDYVIKTKPLDLFFEVGGGIDFYMTYFKLSTEIKMSYGTQDILVHDSNKYNRVISELKSKMFLFSLIFE